MMKLYCAPGSCSLASHIVLEESGLQNEAVYIDFKTRRTRDGRDYDLINPKGYVPCLQLGSGELLCENAALLPYLGELNPASSLIPQHGTPENYRVREWTAFVSVELHKNLSPLFRPATPEVTREAQRTALAKRFAYIEARLGAGPNLTGEHFTVADAYLFVVLSWFPRWQANLAQYPNLQAFYGRVRGRPAVQKVIGDEGLPI
jgi:glutathione S-transferase